MRTKLFLYFVVATLILCWVGVASAMIEITGFNENRARSPLVDSAGNPDPSPSGASILVNTLLNPANFGPGGVVPSSVEMLPFVDTVEPGSLVDENGHLKAKVFFGCLNQTDLAAAEVDELIAFVNSGGVLLVSGNSGPNEGPSWNPLFVALGAGNLYPGSITLSANFVLSSVPIATPVTTGPFGVVGSLTHTPWRDIVPASPMIGVARGNPGTSVDAFIVAESQLPMGYISATGDPLYFNMFTSTDNDNLNYYLNAVAMAAINVEIDIKPGSCPNPLNTKSKGVTPVAIVSTPGFAAPSVNPATVKLEGVSPVKWEELDSTEPHPGNPADCYDCFDADALPPEDCDGDGVLDGYCGDGLMDLVLYFDTQELAAIPAIADAGDGVCVMLDLEGWTGSAEGVGSRVVGADSVIVKKKGKPAPSSANRLTTTWGEIKNR